MRKKIAFIGAGSAGFTKKLVHDILAVPELRNIDISFTDINPHTLDMVTQLCQRDIDANNLDIKIVSTLDRRKALENADYVINVARIGGLEAFKDDIDIPLRYKLDQCVGDTLCAGGIMYGQRGIPAILDFCKDIREVAKPNCLMLSYANPNAMITWAANKYGKVKTIGLCHGVQHGHSMLAKALGYKKEEVDIICAGINHQTWYISVKHKGIEQLDKLYDALINDEEIYPHEKVRIDMLKRFGYFSTESNGHLSEYLPWYRSHVDKIKDWVTDRSWIGGETGGYLKSCTRRNNWYEEDFGTWLKEEPKIFDYKNRTVEHGSRIIEAIETNRTYRGHFNVVNNGCITNLPDDAIIEVPGYVDTHGLNIPKVGDLPLGCAAICNASISVQRLSVEAAVKGDDTLLRQAMMLDPLTGACLTPDEIWQMTDEFLVEQAKWLPQYKEAIKKAEQSIKDAKANGSWIETAIDYKGAVPDISLKKSLEEREKQLHKR